MLLLVPIFEIFTTPHTQSQTTYPSAVLLCSSSWHHQLTTHSAMGSFARIKAFLLGPEYITITGHPGADVEEACRTAPAAASISAVPFDGTVVEVSLTAPDRDKSKLPAQPELGQAAFRCSSALGSQLQSRSIADFDRDKQVYQKHELSPLPFQPPAFWSYATSMLAGTFKVSLAGQYHSTGVPVRGDYNGRPNVMQHAVERYWSLQQAASPWQSLLFVIFISYPMITLTLVVLTNNEMVIRRFIYYRLMSLQVIVDWENTSIWRLWFFMYFSASFVLLLVYSFWAGWLTSGDKTVSVWPQMSIVAMQSMLLFMFWLNIVSMEEQLISLNKVIENSPAHAKELIQHCEVVTEAQLKAAFTNTYKRKKEYKKLSQADQDRAGRQLMETGDSAAAFFDINSLRSTSSKRRNTKDAPVVDGPAKSGCGCCSWFRKFSDWVDEIVWRKLYAVNFATSFLLSFSMFRLHRSGRDRAAATMWPFPADAIYFRALAVLSGICALTVFAIEVYAIWFVVFASDIRDRDTYGILECKMCYDYQSAAGATCSMKPQTEACWGVATRGYCSMLASLTQSYGLNITQVQATCP